VPRPSEIDAYYAAIDVLFWALDVPRGLLDLFFSGFSAVLPVIAFRVAGASLSSFEYVKNGIVVAQGYEEGSATEACESCCCSTVALRERLGAATKTLRLVFLGYHMSHCSRPIYRDVCTS